MNKDARIIIGHNVGMSSTCVWAKCQIIIGNNVQIGGDSIIMDHDAHPHDFVKRRKDYLEQVGPEIYFSEIPTLPIVIEDDVWIGARCVILKGVTIGARSIIAAGSVVTKSIPRDCVAGGVPCRVLKLYDQKCNE